MPNQYSGYRIRPNHSNALPRYILAYGAETTNVRNPDIPGRSSNVFSGGALISCRLADLKATAIKPRLVHRQLELWQQIESLSAQNYTTWVVGHSILYDLVVSGLPDQFQESKLVIDWPRSKRKREDNDDMNTHAGTLVIINNPPTIIACRNVSTGGRVVIVDLMNWFPVSLDELSEMVNRDKGDCHEMPVAFEDMGNKAMWKASIVFESFLRLIRWSRAEDMGMFRYTSASQAMSAYRHRFMEHTLYIHDNADVKKLERSAYFGGRTELFKSGKFTDRVHQLDVSSLFPSVMLGGSFPCKLERFEITDKWNRELPDIDFSRSVARVHIRTKNPIYPLRKKWGNIYPIGEFVTELCGEELLEAKETGRIVAVESWAEYQTEKLFHLWVNYMWELRLRHRLSGDFIYANLVKNMLNGLYGKFAQKSSEWVNVPGIAAATPWSEWTELNAVTNERKRLRAFGWQLQESVPTGEVKKTFVAISAFISAAARMRMNHLRSLAGQFNVYYQGVDSLLVTQKGFDNLEDAGELSEDRLGKLRRQDMAEGGEIFGYCDYRIGDKVVTSGLSGNATVMPDGELLQQIMHVSSSLFHPIKGGGVPQEGIPWSRDARTAKGVVDQDGWVWPFVIPSGNVDASPLASAAV